MRRSLLVACSCAILPPIVAFNRGTNPFMLQARLDSHRHISQTLSIIQQSQNGRATWHQSFSKIQSRKASSPNDNEGPKGIEDFLQAGPKMTVPADIKKKLYEVESNTEAAQGRKTRVIAFVALAAFGFLLLLGNTFVATIAEQNAGVVPEGLDFTSNIPFLSTKWGGVVDILTAGLFGTLVEVEYRTRDENVERIWQEMKRREQQNEEGAKKKIKSMPVSTSKGGTSKSKKQKKRLAALAEVASTETTVEGTPPMASESEAKDNATTPETKSKEEEGGGIFGAAKRFYKQADEMAAAQALLLNKKLEEEGIVEKITDETGLRVVGRDAAKKGSSSDKTNEQKEK